MSSLPDVQPVPTPPTAVVYDGSVLLTLAGLQPGWYTTRDLFPRYLAVMERRGEEPGNKIQFGGAIKLIAADSRYIHDHIRAWHITPEVLKRAQQVADGVARYEPRS